MKNIRILAISGSLRKLSYNSALINAVCKLAPEDIEVIIFNELNLIPLFNPDIEHQSFDAVNSLRNKIKLADGILIASPEYAHGITGVLKNALDWLVSGDEFPDKPVMLANTSPRACHAQQALREVIVTMSGNIIESASISVQLLGTELDVNTIIADQEISQDLIKKITVFREAIEMIRE
jgi:NAD(P)H-dependent FMN reductase